MLKKKRHTINRLTLPLGFSSNANYAVVMLCHGKADHLNIKFTVTNKHRLDEGDVNFNKLILSAVHSL